MIPNFKQRLEESLMEQRIRDERANIVEQYSALVIREFSRTKKRIKAQDIMSSMCKTDRSLKLPEKNDYLRTLYSKIFWKNSTKLLQLLLAVKYET